ncbi:CRIB domain-containing protein RIC10-like [Phoenix dactylifera]|uniref:CRIB domain-containing protein RIC10-like n=1 Tax=Phoenix dactylifera TaxID=42345 RepID=A0A8B7C0Y9_PHODC|nr:CRIB domain-containing protein RIC10-like [Phoenix dactylifera]
MATKMKGLLKGLRYISQIFDTDTKEQEMQIGYPTDVKHVAHIGWDGPSVNAPSWMSEFRSSSAPLSGNEAGAPPKNPSSEFGGARDSAARGLQELLAPRPSRRNASSGGSSVDSPRQSRRHQSSSSTAIDSPVREPLEGWRHSRRHRSSAGLRQESASGSGGGSESQEGCAAVPKRDRPRRKTKGSSSGGGSVRSTSRSKAVASESEGVVESQSSYSVPSLKTTTEEEGF